MISVLLVSIVDLEQLDVFGMLHGFVDEKAMIAKSSDINIFLSLENPCTSLLVKEKT